MKEQALAIWSDMKAWAASHPVIVCMAASLLAVFVIGYWAGAS